MNPIPIAAYLESRSNSREKRNEQLRAMAMQAMQQQLALAQQGMEMRDREFSRNLQQKQFEQQTKASEDARVLTQLQIDEARRVAGLAPIKDQQQFLTPILEPYNAYKAALTAYNDYMKPGAVKFRPASEIRTYADKLRQARGAALAARDTIGRLAASTKYPGIDNAYLEQQYPIEPLPILGAPSTSNTGGGQSSVTGQVTGQGFNGPQTTTALPPPPPAQASATGGVVRKENKNQGPPIQIKPFSQTLMDFKTFLDPIKIKEENLSYSDLYEKEQKTVDETAQAMMVDVMDSFIPRTWNRLGTGRNHAEMNAADFAEHALNPEMLSDLMARYLHGDSMQMRSVILERYASLLSRFGLHPKLTQRLMTETKDRMAMDLDAEQILGAKQQRQIRSATAQREAELYPYQLKEAKVKANVAEKTMQTEIDAAAARLANLQKEGLLSQKKLDKWDEDAKKAERPVWSKILGAADKFWESNVDKRVRESIKLVQTILTTRRRDLISSGQGSAAIDASLDKLARLSNMLQGPPQTFYSAYNSNDRNLLSIVKSYKKTMYDIVKDDPNIGQYFTHLGGTTDEGIPED